MSESIQSQAYAPWCEDDMREQEWTGSMSDQVNNPSVESGLEELEQDLPAERQPPEEGENGGQRLYVHERFESQFLSSARNILVYVPGGYEEDTEQRYPVLYLHDGQNLFDGRTSHVPGLTWNVHNTADRLIAEGEIQPLIIVGIYNTGVHRINEYTPTRDPVYGGGDAGLYGRLLTEELKPWVDENYRTLGAAEHTGLGGSSLGGLVTLYLGLQRPDVFSRLAVLSPSVWWHRRSILSIVKKSNPVPRPRIWLDMGTDEGPAGVRNSDQLHQALLERGWRDGEDLLYTRVQGGRHNEGAWAKRVGPFLKFLFPAGETRAGEDS
jgi:predicted alpha/beta superfamily hydrolase